MENVELKSVGPTLKINIFCTDEKESMHDTAVNNCVEPKPTTPISASNCVKLKPTIRYKYYYLTISFI